MIPPREQWCIQIELTNACNRRCSNCTRLLAHARTPFFISVEQFRAAVGALRDFLYDSPPDHYGRRKVLGLIGGEPQLHPQFREICAIFVDEIPQREARGLWTGLPIAPADHDWIHATFGYLNHNLHDPPSVHAPVLVAIEEVIRQRGRMWWLIGRCWLQQRWSSTITPKGFFLCEVMGALDWIFDGPGGLAVEPGCWAHDLEAYQEQILRWCPRCGIALENLPGRPDAEEIDDLTVGNLEALRRRQSPRVLAGRYRIFDAADFGASSMQQEPRPWQYLRRSAP